LWNNLDQTHYKIYYQYLPHLLDYFQYPEMFLLPISGDVSIVQSNKSPSGSSIVTLKDEVPTGTLVAPIDGETAEKIGAEFSTIEPPI
jgi:hypothetical protein